MYWPEASGSTRVLVSGMADDEPCGGDNDCIEALFDATEVARRVVDPTPPYRHWVVSALESEAREIAYVEGDVPALIRGSLERGWLKAYRPLRRTDSFLSVHFSPNSTAGAPLKP